MPNALNLFPSRARERGRKRRRRRNEDILSHTKIENSLPANLQMWTERKIIGVFKAKGKIIPHSKNRNARGNKNQ
jgi:hypothetical protein